MSGDCSLFPCPPLFLLPLSVPRIHTELHPDLFTGPSLLLLCICRGEGGLHNCQQFPFRPSGKYQGVVPIAGLAGLFVLGRRKTSGFLRWTAAFAAGAFPHLLAALHSGFANTRTILLEGRQAAGGLREILLSLVYPVRMLDASSPAVKHISLFIFLIALVFLLWRGFRNRKVFVLPLLYISVSLSFALGKSAALVRFRIHYIPLALLAAPFLYIPRKAALTLIAGLWLWKGVYIVRFIPEANRLQHITRKEIAALRWAPERVFAGGYWDTFLFNPLLKEEKLFVPLPVACHNRAVFHLIRSQAVHQGIFRGEVLKPVAVRAGSGGVCIRAGRRKGRIRGYRVRMEAEGDPLPASGMDICWKLPWVRQASFKGLLLLRGYPFQEFSLKLQGRTEAPYPSVASDPLKFFCPFRLGFHPGRGLALPRRFCFHNLPSLALFLQLEIVSPFNFDEDVWLRRLHQELRWEGGRRILGDGVNSVIVPVRGRRNICFSFRYTFYFRAVDLSGNVLLVRAGGFLEKAFIYLKEGRKQMPLFLLLEP